MMSMFLGSVEGSSALDLGLGRLLRYMLAGDGADVLAIMREDVGGEMAILLACGDPVLLFPGDWY